MKDKSNMSNAALGFAAGVAAGAAATTLFTPSSGKEMRTRIKDKASSVQENTNSKVNDLTEKVANKADDVDMKLNK